MLKFIFKTLWTKYYMGLNGQVLFLSPAFAQSHTGNSNSKTQGRRIVDILQQLTTSQMMMSVTFTQAHDMSC